MQKMRTYWQDIEFNFLTVITKLILILLEDSEGCVKSYKKDPYIIKGSVKHKYKDLPIWMNKNIQSRCLSYLRVLLSKILPGLSQKE